MLKLAHQYFPILPTLPASALYRGTFIFFLICWEGLASVVAQENVEALKRPVPEAIERVAKQIMAKDAAGLKTALSEVQSTDILLTPLPGVSSGALIGTVMELAIRNDFETGVEILIESGMPVIRKARQDYSPLHYAIWLQKLNILKLLVENGADVNQGIKDVEGGHIGDNITPLFSAASVNSLPIVQFLIAKGADATAVTSRGLNMLHASIMMGYLTPDLAKAFLDAGVDLNAPTKRGNTPLHVAVSMGKASTTQMLLDLGADPSLKNKDGQTAVEMAFLYEGTENFAIQVVLNALKTPLVRAVESDDMDKAKELLKEEPVLDRNYGVEKLSLLHLAMPHENRREWLAMLLDAGCNIEMRNREHETILHLATKEKDVDLVKFLLGKGANPDSRQNIGLTPLHIAVRNNDLKMMTTLVEHGVSVNQSAGDEQSSPLVVAAWAGHLEVARWLVEHGADIHYQNARGVTPLHYADGVEMARFLMEKDARVDAEMHGGLTPLHLAGERENPELVRLLLEHGADVNSRSKDGKTPLFGSAGIYNPDNVEVVRVFIEAGADVNVRREDGMTPLHFAVRYNNIEKAKLLIASGAEVNAKDNTGARPLHLPLLPLFSRNSKTAEMAKLLLDSGAEVDAEAQMGMTPLMMAVKLGNVEKTAVLLLAGAETEKKNKEGQTALDLAHIYLEYCGKNKEALEQLQQRMQVEEALMAVHATYLFTNDTSLVRDADSYERIIELLEKKSSLAK